MTDKEKLAQIESEIKANVSKVLSKAENMRRISADGDFWNLGEPKPRVYKKPDFADSPIETSDISSDNISDTAELEIDAPRSEKIDRDSYAREDRPTETGGVRYRAADNTEIHKNIDVFDDIGGASDEKGMNLSLRMTVSVKDGRQTVSPAVRTGSYKKRGRPAPRSESVQVRPSGVISKYTPDGLLLNSIEVSAWDSDVDFYGRFAENAAKSHMSKSNIPRETSITPSKFLSYVPQYSHMNREQVESYRWLRENFRHGKYPKCDFSYILLYIYEIINLPELISPEDGAEQLAGLWLGYRGTEARLDSCLCEWLTDYCMIRGIGLPARLRPILPEIVPKAQFKEFFLNLDEDKMTGEDYILLSRILIENSSDYDYRRSKYYNENKDEYENHIPRAVAAAVRCALSGKQGAFTLERTYKMPRDTYCGAIVSAEIKRKLNIEFRSFTRSANTREIITAAVKHSENSLRTVLGIKAKLKLEGLLPADGENIDRYFAPLMPVKETKNTSTQPNGENSANNAERAREDELYGAVDHGFDFETAVQLERSSWKNTELLTAADDEEEKPVEKLAVTVEEDTITENTAEAAPDETFDNDAAATETDDEEHDIREGLFAALAGRYHEYCAANRIYDGVLADRINTAFLDIMGDVVLEESGNSYVLIEDYREDVEEWLK